MFIVTNFSPLSGDAPFFQKYLQENCEKYCLITYLFCTLHTFSAHLTVRRARDASAAAARVQHHRRHSTHGESDHRRGGHDHFAPLGMRGMAEGSSILLGSTFLAETSCFSIGR